MSGERTKDGTLSSRHIAQGRHLRHSDTRDVIHPQSIRNTQVKKEGHIRVSQVPATYTHKPQEECSPFLRLRFPTHLTTEKPALLTPEILAMQTSGILSCSLLRDIMAQCPVPLGHPGTLPFQT